jgi:hypothetical protein
MGPGPHPNLEESVMEEEYEQELHEMNPEKLLKEYDYQDARYGSGKTNWKLQVVRKHLLKRIVYFAKPHGTKE